MLNTDTNRQTDTCLYTLDYTLALFAFALLSNALMILQMEHSEAQCLNTNSIVGFASAQQYLLP